EDWPPPDETVDADRLTWTVVDELDLGVLHEYRLAVGRQLKTHYAGGTHHLLGRNAVNTFGEDTHEFDAAAGDDESLETVGAEIAQQLQHRLVDQLGIGPIETGVARRGDPVGDELREGVSGHAGMGYRHDLEKSRFTKRRQSFDVAIEHRLERLLGFPIRMLRRQRPHPIHRKHDLEVHRLLRPQGACVVRGLDALLGFDIVGRAFAGYTVDKVDYRFFTGAVVPSRQLIAFRAAERVTTEN